MAIFTKKRIIFAMLFVIVSGLLLVLPGRPFLREVIDKLLLRRGMENLGSAIRVLPRDTPYDKWFVEASSEMPFFKGSVIDDVRTVKLQPWPEMGERVNGLYLRLADYQMTDGRILEIPEGGKTEPRRHMFEMGVYFFGGPGHTTIQHDGKSDQRIDWDYGSVFAIPLNVRYQHFNDSEKPIRLVAVTSFPFILNATNNLNFIFDNSFEFTDRYNSDEDYWQKQHRLRNNLTVTNFVADAVQAELDEHNFRGKGAKNMHWSMSGNTMLDLHVSEMPAKMHKKAHRSTSEAIVLMLSGEGYSLIWPEGAYDRRQRINWHEGTLFVPPIYWYRQFFNPGLQPARNLAISVPKLVTNLGLRFLDQLEKDLPEIEREWVKELRH